MKPIGSLWQSPKIIALLLSQSSNSTETISSLVTRALAHASRAAADTIVEKIEQKKEAYQKQYDDLPKYNAPPKIPGVTVKNHQEWAPKIETDITKMDDVIKNMDKLKTELEGGGHQKQLEDWIKNPPETYEEWYAPLGIFEEFEDAGEIHPLDQQGITAVLKDTLDQVEKIIKTLDQEINDTSKTLKKYKENWEKVKEAIEYYEQKKDKWDEKTENEYHDDPAHDPFFPPVESGDGFPKGVVIVGDSGSDFPWGPAFELNNQRRIWTIALCFPGAKAEPNAPKR